mmetsp:Transcript_95713/g.194538  ORF Transcript_95713/g.194538 Transcript_95713/m.194538 type:complete len:357 (+) Transcript_95713:264-1334(+)
MKAPFCCFVGLSVTIKNTVALLVCASWRIAIIFALLLLFGTLLCHFLHLPGPGPSLFLPKGRRSETVVEFVIVGRLSLGQLSLADGLGLGDPAAVHDRVQNLHGRLSLRHYDLPGGGIFKLALLLQRQRLFPLGLSLPHLVEFSERRRGFLNRRQRGQGGPLAPQLVVGGLSGIGAVFQVHRHAHRQRLGILPARLLADLVSLLSCLHGPVGRALGQVPGSFLVLHSALDVAIHPATLLLPFFLPGIVVGVVVRTDLHDGPLVFFLVGLFVSVAVHPRPAGFVPDLPRSFFFVEGDSLGFCKFLPFRFLFRGWWGHSSRKPDLVVRRQRCQRTGIARFGREIPQALNQFCATIRGF